jgi:hypothetical protein
MVVSSGKAGTEVHLPDCDLGRVSLAPFLTASGLGLNCYIRRARFCNFGEHLLPLARDHPVHNQ